MVSTGASRVVSIGATWVVTRRATWILICILSLILKLDYKVSTAPEAPRNPKTMTSGPGKPSRAPYREVKEAAQGRAAIQQPFS